MTPEEIEAAKVAKAEQPEVIAAKAEAARRSALTPEQRKKEDDAIAARKVKADKFVELAAARTSKAMDSIANLKGLANRQNYVFTEDQVKKICEALVGEVNVLATSFANPTAKAATKFSFD